MATTFLVATSNRFGSYVYLAGTVTLVAADAQIVEYFRLPTGYGDVLIRSVKVDISSFSGAYVAPAPAYDGPSIGVVDSALVSVADDLVMERFVHHGTSATRPTLGVTKELQHHRLFRGDERIIVNLPILAGAGVTVTMTCSITALRLQGS